MIKLLGAPIFISVSILFNTYLKPPGEILKNLGGGVGCHQSADGTQLYFSLSSESAETAGAGIMSGGCNGPINRS